MSCHAAHMTKSLSLSLYIYIYIYMNIPPPHSWSTTISEYLGNGQVRPRACVINSPCLTHTCQTWSNVQIWHIYSRARKNVKHVNYAVNQIIVWYVDLDLKPQLSQQLNQSHTLILLWLKLYKGRFLTWNNHSNNLKWKTVNCVIMMTDVLRSLLCTW